MQKNITHLALADLIFVLFLVLSGTFAEFSDIFYALAFAIPICMLLITESEGEALSIRITAADSAFIPLLAPILVGGVFLISFLTASFFSLFGISSAVTLSGSTLVIVIEHALLPAVLEELLFRYAPIRLLGGMKRGNIILISALFFALSHCSLLQLPYAMFAGVIFAAVDIATGSIIPSLILHFINNLISIWWSLSLYKEAPVAFIVILSALAVLSLCALILLRKRYTGRLISLITELELERPPVAATVFVIATLVCALATAIGGFAV